MEIPEQSGLCDATGLVSSPKMPLTTEPQGPCSDAVHRSVWIELIALALLAVAVAALFQTSPHNGDFWWSDAPRHAMDGVFYRDFLRDLPFNRIKEYAVDYYLQYPALTILFYPPLLPLAEALFYTLFGVSHFTAQLTVAFFYLMAAWGAYVL